ncbi:hypothetical protein B7P43_G17030 [Cryptotermes secundus]|uniref:CCHC-type domain-containing protein n=1 Tax=Cryptotermes secundus TaxID=105785 RepID=A0A2J7PGL8_9NEOP|nr:hypothetical protein B7P43_G17030 [Cryptotermes secundus]
MPTAWIHSLSKQQAESLATELGVSVDGTLDDLRRKLKEKWSLLEPHLPSQFIAKSEPAMDAAASGANVTINAGIPGQVSYVQAKMRGRVVNDLVKNIPVLSGTDPETVLQFLIRAQEVYDLNLVGDLEFLSLLVGRTSGRVTQILGFHLGTSSKWELVSSEISSTFLPPRIREDLVSNYVLRRFQSPTEDLTQFIMSVIAAARILNFNGSQSDLVQRIVQNMHPRVRVHLVFGSKPTTISELHALASQVAEARAIDSQRQGSENKALAGASQGAGRASRQVSMAIDQGQRVRSEGVVCWKCSGKGHLRRHCPSSLPLPSSNRGNEQGARQ